MHHLIAIRGDMDEEFAKNTNKQGKICEHKLFLESIMNIN